MSLRLGGNGYLTDIDDGEDDAGDWNLILNNINTSERSWLDSPWIISEFYFYRRLVSIFKYFETSYDPFCKQKMHGTLHSLPVFEEIAKVVMHIDEWFFNSDIILFGLLTSLWGNKKDLSIWPAPQDSVWASESTSMDHSTVQQQPQVLSSISAIAHLKASSASNILDNQLDQVVDYLIREASSYRGNRSVGIVVDNAGFELLCDLTLGHVLIAAGVVDTVTFHTKKHPTFVSDATTRDCMEAISNLACASFGDCSRPHSVELTGLWRAHVDADRFLFQEDFFWCQPTPFDLMPDSIRSRLSAHYLTVVKVGMWYLLGIYDIISTMVLNVCIMCRVTLTTGDFSMIERGLCTHLQERFLINGSRPCVH